eukprot:scaffold4223_cov189-Amphora_coffeaeformis.AAC.61
MARPLKKKKLVPPAWPLRRHGSGRRVSSSRFEFSILLHCVLSAVELGIKMVTGRQSLKTFLVFTCISAFFVAFRASDFVQKHEPASTVQEKEVKVVPKDLYNPNRPYFVLHVGPHKTATTSIQSFLMRHRQTFRKNDYEAFGPGASRMKSVINCLAAHLGQKDPTNAPECLAKPLTDLEAMAAQGKNVLFSSEQFMQTNTVDMESFAWQVFFQTLQQHFRVKVVMYYRRHFDRLPSIWNQKFKPQRGTGKSIKWPGHQNGQDIPSFLEFFEATLGVSGKTRFGLGTAFRTELVPNTANTLEHMRLDGAMEIHIRSYYCEDILEDFFCHVVPDAPTVCGMFHGEKAYHPPTINSSVDTIDYDSIALEAHRLGILPPKTTRSTAMQQAQRYQEKILNLTVADLPQACLSEELLDKMREISYQHEQRIMPSLIETHNESFVKANQKGKFCSVNATKVLEDPGWKNFLGGNSSVP